MGQETYHLKNPNFEKNVFFIFSTDISHQKEFWNTFLQNKSFTLYLRERILKFEAVLLSFKKR